MPFVRFRFIFIFLSLLLISSCGKHQDNRTQSDSETNIVIAQWGSEKYLIYLPVYIAQEEGIFESKDLNVKIEFSGNDDQVFAKVLRGDAHFGVGDPIFTAISRQNGADGVVIASVVDKVALWGISKQELMTNDLVSDLKGKRIGSFPKPSTTYTLLKDTIEKQNLENTSIVEIPIGNELALLESGNADVVMLLEPAASIAESRGYKVAYSFPKFWGQFSFTGLTSTATYANTNKEIVSKMKESLQEAVNLAHSNPNKAINVAKKLFPNIDPIVLENAVSRMLKENTIPLNVDIQEEAWISSINVRQDIGDVNRNNNCLECIWK